MIHSKDILGRSIPINIINTLNMNEVKTHKSLTGDYIIVHNKTQQQFDKLIKELCVHHGLKAQHSDWFPGTPTGHVDDFGYYVCPIEPDEEVGDFDMVITMGHISYC